MDPNLRGGTTPYSEARFFPPLKPLPFPARLRANALRTQILLSAVIFIQISIILFRDKCKCFRDEVSSEPDNDALLRFRLAGGSFCLQVGDFFFAGVLPVVGVASGEAAFYALIFF